MASLSCLARRKYFPAYTVPLQPVFSVTLAGSFRANAILDLFFAERHTSQSSFTMETSIELQNIPEPGVWAWAGAMALAALGVVRRRRPY